MANLDPVIARDVPLHELPLPAALYPRASVMSVAKHVAIPIVIGAGVAAAAAGIIALRSSRKRPTFTLFAESKSTLLATVAKAAAIAGGRAFLRRALRARAGGSSAA
jgi:hypothetical protein